MFAAIGLRITKIQNKGGMKTKGRRETGKTSDGTRARIVVEGVSWRREKRENKQTCEKDEKWGLRLPAFLKARQWSFLYFTQARAVRSSILD